MDRFGVIVDELDCFPHLRLLRFRLGNPQHLLVEIEPDSLHAAAGQTEGQITGTAADIERHVAWLRAHELEDTPFPIAVQAKALKIIDQVVAPRDNGE